MQLKVFYSFISALLLESLKKFGIFSFYIKNSNNYNSSPWIPAVWLIVNDYSFTILLLQFTFSIEWIQSALTQTLVCLSVIFSMKFLRTARQIGSPYRRGVAINSRALPLSQHCAACCRDAQSIWRLKTKGYRCVYISEKESDFTTPAKPCIKKKE